MFTILVRKQGLGLRGPPFTAAAWEARKGLPVAKSMFLVWFGFSCSVCVCVCVCVCWEACMFLVWFGFSCSLCVWVCAEKFAKGSRWPKSMFLVWFGFSCSVCVCVRVIGHSVVSDFTTPRIVAHQALLPMGFPRQEYWSGLPFPTPGNLLGPGIKPCRLLHLLHCKRVLYCRSKYT